MTATPFFSAKLLGSITMAICAFVISPFIVVALVSLTPDSFISIPRNGISLRWYEALWNDTVFIEAFWNSFVVAISASGAAVLLGVLPAVAVVRYRFFGRRATELFVTSPLFIPMVMIGLAILVFSSNLGITSQPLRLILAHTALTIPYVFRASCASLIGFDINQELAARNLGAGPLRAFVVVTMPQLRAGLIAGAVFAFVVSFDNVGISIFLTGAQTTTLPVELLAYVSADNDPMSAALSTLLLLGSIGVLLIAERLVGMQRLLRIEG